MNINITPQYEMYIDGKWTGKELEQIDVVNPATNNVIATVPKGGKIEARQAVDSAYDAFLTWAKKTAEERSELLIKWHQLINKEKEKIGKLMTEEQGKPLKEAIGEVNYANKFISWYAEEGKRIRGETIPASHPDKRILIQKQPVGVVAAITPWNFPAAMITRKVAPALASGCTVVIKPATKAPLTAFKLVELAEEAGIPKGVINIITGSSSQIGETWLSDQRVRKITFTGSTEVGKILMRDASNTVKKISLELGGHAPLIIMEDADLDKAVQGLIASKFRNAGQTCICTNRVYVHERVKQAFTKKLLDAVAKLKVGNGLDEGTDIGPLIDEEAIEKVTTHVQDAVKNGGKIVFGGGRLELNKGYFFEPTVITDADDGMLCMNQETFGPLIPIASFESEQEVITRANDTPFGLASYVFTENIRHAIQISEALEYGIVGLNDGAPSTPQAPFGGYKESGLGREGGPHGIDEFLETKYVSIAL